MIAQPGEHLALTQVAHQGQGKLAQLLHKQPIAELTPVTPAHSLSQANEVNHVDRAEQGNTQTLVPQTQQGYDVMGNCRVSG